MSRWRLGERLHKFRWISLALLVAGTVAAGFAVTPLQYDFSFTTLFVGEGEDYDQLRDYLDRFGSDVNFVMVAVEAPDLFSADVMGELRALTERLENLEGVAEVVSPTNVDDLVGDGGSLRSQPVVPDDLSAADWPAVQTLACTHPLLAGTVFGSDGEHAALFVKYGIEAGPARCSDGVDNDAGGGIDCQDISCRLASGQGVCDEQPPGSPERSNAACTNAFDDDGDGLLNCDDPDCATLGVCAWVGSAEADRALCNNGLDDDGDGAIDCADRDCLIHPDVPYCNVTRAITSIVNQVDERARAEEWGSLYLGGVPIVSEEYTRVIQHDMRTFLPLTGCLVALVLVFLFRSVRGVVLPMAVVGVGVLWAIGALMGTGGKLNMINSSMPTLMLVIAIADAVHILSRYLEESDGAPDASEATRRTMRHMASACLLTTVTSAVGFGSLLSAHLPIIRNFGLYTGIGILLAYVVTMLLMPPVLASLALPSDRDRRRARSGDRLASAVTGVFVELVTRRKPLATGIVIVICGVMVAGGSTVRVNNELMEELRHDNPAAIAHAAIEAHHGGILSGALMFSGPPNAFAEPEALNALVEVAAYAEAWRWPDDGRQLVSGTASVADVVLEAHEAYRGGEEFRTIPSSRAAVVSLLDQVPAEQRESVISADYGTAHVTMRMYSVGSKAWGELRAELTREVDARSDALGEGVEWYFTGSSTLGQDAMAFMTRDLITSLLIAVVIIMVLMSILFRSIPIGLLSMIPNMFPLLVTLGLVGLWGIDVRVSTAVVFSISLGIAVDDTIHLLVRFKEELRRTTDYELAMVRAIEGAGKAIVFTTLMLCIGFGMLALSEFTAVRELGFLGGATLVSALVGDLLVLPLVLLWLRPNVRDPVDSP